MLESISYLKHQHQFFILVIKLKDLTFVINNFKLMIITIYKNTIKILKNVMKNKKHFNK